MFDTWQTPWLGKAKPAAANAHSRGIRNNTYKKGRHKETALSGTSGGRPMLAPSRQCYKDIPSHIQSPSGVLKTLNVLLLPHPPPTIPFPLHPVTLRSGNIDADYRIPSGLSMSSPRSTEPGSLPDVIQTPGNFDTGGARVRAKLAVSRGRSDACGKSGKDNRTFRDCLHHWCGGLWHAHFTVAAVLFADFLKTYCIIRARPSVLTPSRGG